MEQPTSPNPRYVPLTWGAVGLGLACGVFVSIVQVVTRIQLYTVIFPFHSTFTLPFGLVFSLFLVVVGPVG